MDASADTGRQNEHNAKSSDKFQVIGCYFPLNINADCIFRIIRGELRTAYFAQGDGVSDKCLYYNTVVTYVRDARQANLHARDATLVHHVR